MLAESKVPGPRRRGQTCGGGQRGRVRTQRDHGEAGLRSRLRARLGAPGQRRRLGSEEGVARHGRPCVRVPKGTARARQNATATMRLGTGRGEVEARRRCEDRARATAKGHSAGAKAGFVPRVWVWPRPCVRSVLVCARGEGKARSRDPTACTHAARARRRHSESGRSRCGSRQQDLPQRAKEAAPKLP